MGGITRVGRPHQPIRRGRDSPSAVMSTRRAGCLDRGSSGSTEAHRSNPRLECSERRRSARESNPGVLSDRANVLWNRESGRQRKTSSDSLDSFEAVVDEAGENPAGGVRAQGVRSTRAGVGSLWPGDRRNRLFDRSRGPSANPRAAKSSTMKGPQGLASHSDRGRCRTANASHRGISGRF